MKRIYFRPPLAFARVGSSPDPLEAFDWAPNDVAPHGTGKTTLKPIPSLLMSPEGALTEEPARETIEFRDADGRLKPVCPFFELWCTRVDAEGEEVDAPVTVDVLRGADLELADVAWTVEVANLKAYHMSQAPGDQVRAQVTLKGDDGVRRPLNGVSPQVVGEPLIPEGQSVPLGSVQLSRPNAALPELRLRFTPPAGVVYAPTDFAERVRTLRGVENDYRIPASRTFLNPSAAWPQLVLGADSRTNPGGLFMQDSQGRSLGVVDDVCDGLIKCRLEVGGRTLTATARIVSGPPDYAPDRRPFNSLADGLKDRVDRDEGVASDDEVKDLFERILETMGLSNLEVQNARSARENERLQMASGDTGPRRGPAFPQPPQTREDPLPLTDRGRQWHRAVGFARRPQGAVAERARFLGETGPRTAI